MIIPQEQRWNQSNASDLFGNIAQTKNITFDNDGYLKLSNSVRATTNSVLQTNIGRVVALSTTVTAPLAGYIAITDNRSFGMAEDILKEIPTDLGSALNGNGLSNSSFWDGEIIWSRNNNVAYYGSGAGSMEISGNFLTSGGDKHVITQFLSKGDNVLAISNLNEVYIIEAFSSSVPTILLTLTIPSDFLITSMVYFNQNLYIGTRNRTGSLAAMYVWNGTGEAPQQVFEVDSNIIIDLVMWRDSVVALLGNGSLVRFNGGGFDMLDAFPIYYSNITLPIAKGNTLSRGITMSSHKDKIYINISSSDARTSLNMPHGIWCFDPQVGLYHRYALSRSTTRTGTVSSVSSGDNEVTIGTSIVPITGTEAFFEPDTGATIGGLSADTKYFVIKKSDTVFSLATTKQNALDGVAINITSAGSGTRKFVFFPNADFGSFWNFRAGSVLPIQFQPLKTQFSNDIMWGGSIYNADTFLGSASETFIGSTSDEVESRGYFITPKILNPNILNQTNNFVIKFKPLRNELDKIVIKYRNKDDGVEESEPIEWTSATTFTGMTGEIGQEVEILSGKGAGIIGHITSVTGGITIDTSYENYVAGDKARAVIRNWTKLAEIDQTTVDNAKGFFEVQLDASGKFIQIKVELRGIGVTIEQILLDTKTLLPSRR
jgi:hypothetical protein